MTTPGVYRVSHDGDPTLVHEYADDDYELGDVPALLGIGDGDSAMLRLDRRALRELRITAHARSFDHSPDFIRMCLDIAEQQPAPDETGIALVSVG